MVRELKKNITFYEVELMINTICVLDKLISLANKKYYGGEEDLALIDLSKAASIFYHLSNHFLIKY